MAKHRRLHKITFSRHRKHFIRPVFSKLRSKQPNNFPQQPRTQNPPCNTLATIQTSNIERPDPRVTHHDVYHKMDGNQTTKEKTQPSFVEKSLNLIKTPLNIAYQSNTMSLVVTKLPRSHTKSSIVLFNQTFI